MARLVFVCNRCYKKKEPHVASYIHGVEQEPKKGEQIYMSSVCSFIRDT